MGITTYEFTSCGVTGSHGPTQSQINAAYAGTILNGKVTVNTQGVQEWIVPYTGKYTITAYGAQGGENGGGAIGNGGKGRVVASVVSLFKNEKLIIVVGQKGVKCNSGGTSHGGGGGGGGSFVWKSTDTTPIVVAGGGGGASLENNGTPHFLGMDGSITKDGTASRSEGAALSHGGVNGANSPYGNAKGWNAVKSGLTQFVGGVASSYGGHGGFGGGGGSGFGGTGSYSHSAGAGGGYSGGGVAGVEYKYGGGGGGTFSLELPIDYEYGLNSGDGKVVVSLDTKTYLEPYGQWTSEPLSLSVIPDVVKTAIVTWVEVPKAYATITVSTCVKTNRIVDPADNEFIVTTNGGQIPGVVEGDELYGKYLWVRVRISTTELESPSPEISNIVVTLQNKRINAGLDLKI